MFGGQRRATDQSAAADRGEQRVKRTGLFEELDGRGALPGDDVRMIKRRHKHTALLLLQPRGHGFPVPGLAAHHGRAIPFRGLPLRDRRGVRHDNGGFHAQQLPDPGHGLRVIARGKGDHAPALLFFGKLGEGVERAPEFDRADALKILAFQKNGRAAPGVEQARRHHRRDVSLALQTRAGRLNLIESHRPGDISGGIQTIASSVSSAFVPFAARISSRKRTAANRAQQAEDRSGISPGAGQRVGFVRAPDEPAHIQLLRHPFRMAVAEDDIGALGAVIVAGIGEILMGTIVPAGVVLVVNDPDIRGTGALAEEVIAVADLRRAVNVRGDGVLGFAFVDAVGRAAAVLARKEPGHFVAVPVGAQPAGGVVQQVGHVKCVPMQPVLVSGRDSVHPGRPVRADAVRRRPGIPDGVAGGRANEGFEIGNVLGKEPVHIVVRIVDRAGEGFLVVVVAVHLTADAHLFLVVETTDPVGPHLGPGQRGQQHRGQDGDDGNDHQQFNQGKAQAAQAHPKGKPRLTKPGGTS